MSRSMRAPTMSASCSFRRRRGTSASRRRGALGERVRGRAKKVALSVDADDDWLAASIEALKPDMLQLHGRETPERVGHGPQPVPAAGDEGDADRDPRRPLADPALRRCRRPADLRCPRAARGDAARRARQELRLDAAGGHRSRRAVHAVGRARCRRMSRRRCASPSAPAVDVSSGVERAPGDKDPDKIRAFVARRPRGAGAGARKVASGA